MANFKNPQSKINAEQIKVCIRMRPLLPPYEDEDVWGVDTKDNKICSLNNNLVSSIDPMSFAMNQMQNGNLNTIIREKELRRRYQDASQSQAFQFDNVFGTDATTPQIYHVIARPITKSALQGYNGTVFMYGQTTSGKTYTMLGTQEIPGILPCAVRDVFNGIKNDRDNNDYNVWVSYMEIYNECINDLLVPGKTNLKVKDDPNHGVDVYQLKKQQVWTFDQAIILMNYGEEHRIYKETSIHEHSSRSHTIFRLYIESCPKQKSGPKRYSMLNLVDLAGSERLSEFDQKSDTVGETGYINKSLFILSNVINKLAEGKSGHIPYRDSKLTRILQMALGGNSLTAIICTISPAAINYYQTISTLRFATRAKTVKNKPIMNEIIDESELKIQIFQEQIHKLKSELQQKDHEINKFQEQNFLMQQSLDNEAQERERLSQEINTIKGQSPSVCENPQQMNQKYQILKQELKKERQEKVQLQNECETLRNFNSTGNYSSSVQQVSAFQMERLSQQIEKSIQEAVQSSDIFNEINEDKLDLNSNVHWSQETDKLNAQFKIDLLQLQNEYRNKVKNLLEEIFCEEHEYIVTDYVNQNVLKIVDTNERLQASQWANAEKVLQDIEDGSVFEDIQIEFVDVLTKGLERFGYSPKKTLSGEQQPSQEDCDSILEELKDYYGDMIQVVAKRYDEVKVILETYFRQQISMKREILDRQHDQDSNNDEDDYESHANTFSQIAEHHNDKLCILRQGSDNFSRQIEERFDEVLVVVNQWLKGEEEEENYQFSQSQQYAYGLRPHEQHISLPKQSNSFRINLIEETNQEQEFSSGNVMNDKDLNNYVSDSNSYSMQEEPPEVKSSIHTSQLITPTPKFQGSNKFRSQAVNKENSQTINQSSTQLLPRFKSKFITNGISNAQGNQTSQNYKVYVWGSGKDGRCGNGKESSEKVPNVVSVQNKFNQISCGYHHTAAVSSDGMVFTWGRGIFGQLGQGDTENCSLPKPIESLVKIQILQVACGWQHTMALSSQGRVFSWGYGEDGQLGHGDTNDYLSPKEIQHFKQNNIKTAMIACGHSHSACITDSQSPQLYMWGCNPDCRLMIEDNENQHEPTLTILEQAKVHQLQKGNQPAAEAIEPFYVSLGVTHTAVITRSGELFTGGSKLDGQLGVRFAKQHQISSNKGDNSSSQNQNQNELKDLSSPINRVVIFGPQNKAIQVACGDAFTLVLNDKNQVYSFGKASHGRLGLGTQLKQAIENGQDNGDNICEPQIVEALKNEKVVQLSAGCRHASCTTENGKLFTWGFNFYEQLGLGDCEKDFDQPTRVAKNLVQHKVKFVSCGYFHTSALVQISQ